MAHQQDDAIIERLTPAPAPYDLDYQAALTQTLARCRPVLTSVTDGDALLALASAALGVPIGLVSFGPTAADKQSVRKSVRGMG